MISLEGPAELGRNAAGNGKDKGMTCLQTRLERQKGDFSFLERKIGIRQKKHYFWETPDKVKNDFATPNGNG